MKVDISVFKNINDVDKELWKSAAPDEFYFSYAFLKVIYDSKVENAEYRFIVFIHDLVPVGAAVLSNFSLQLDLLAGSKTISYIKSKVPSLFKVPIICCGVPASFGQKHFFVKNEKFNSQCINLVHAEMVKYAVEVNSGLLLWKEFNPSDNIFPHLKELDFIALPTLPDNRITFDTNNKYNFLDNLRSSYRRKFRELEGIISHQGPIWNINNLQLEDNKFGSASVEEFYEGYLKLMNRTPVKLEVYPKDFFIQLAIQTDLEIRLLTLTNFNTNEKLRALIVPNKKVLFFILIAKSKADYQDSLYRKFMNVLVLYAIHKGFEELRMGQTSYYSKMSAGAKPWRLETFILMRTKWKQFLFKKIGKLLFPEIKLPEVRPYKTKNEKMLKNHVIPTKTQKCNPHD